MKYILASDFDKTLSEGDMGLQLFKNINREDIFYIEVDRLRKNSLCQPGAELAYLIIHKYRESVTKEDIEKAGKKIKLKDGIDKLFDLLNSELIEDKKRKEKPTIIPYVISAAPREGVVTALENLLPSERIFATTFEYEGNKIKDLVKVYAGKGKSEAIAEIVKKESVPLKNFIYVGDGESDLFVMNDLKLNRGYPISVSQSVEVGHIANKTVISNNVLAIVIPMLKDVFNYSDDEVRDLFNKMEIQILTWRIVEKHYVGIK